MRPIVFANCIYTWAHLFHGRRARTGSTYRVIPFATEELRIASAIVRTGVTVLECQDVKHVTLAIFSIGGMYRCALHTFRSLDLGGL